MCAGAGGAGDWRARVAANDGETGTLGIGLNTGLIYDRLLWVVCGAGVPVLPVITRNFSSTINLTSALQKMHSSVRSSRRTRSLSSAGMEKERKQSVQVIT